MTDGKRPLRPYSLRAFANFRARLEELGAELLEPEWLGASKKHAVRCSQGHLIQVKPATIQQGRGFCKVCAQRDPVTAERAFRVRLAELGATMIGSYAGAHGKVECICSAGHTCHPTPSQARRGGICAKCAKNNPEGCEARFLARLAELGAKPLYMIWEGGAKGHDALCAAGHLCSPRPSGVLSGEGVCPVCAGNSPEAAEAAFRSRLAELRATLLEPRWLGSGERHHVRDAAGHDCYPTPGNVRSGWGICKICADKSPIVGEQKFLAKIAELGCTPAYEQYKGRNRRHHLICPLGHDCYPTPSSLQRGQGPCFVCAHRDYTVFYVIQHETEPIVKFGVTGQDGRRRLGIHRLGGFTSVHVLMAGLASGVATDAENAVRAALALAGEEPVKGREYFDASCLGLILDVTAGWLGTAA